MKRLVCICVCVLVALSLTACGNQNGDATVVGRGFVFEAVVKEVTEETILVMPVAGSDEAGVAMEIGLLVVKTDVIPAVKVGDRVRIDYDGVITRSIPGQLGEVYSFEIIR